MALDCTAARCRSLAKTGEVIRAGAKKAVERAAAGDFSPLTFDAPLLPGITCASYGLANKLGGVPGADRLDRPGVKFCSESSKSVTGPDNLYASGFEIGGEA
jgi:D-aminopeptidase